jgi:hypothetical protein
MLACMKLFALFLNPHVATGAGLFQREGQRGDIDSTGSNTLSRIILAKVLLGKGGCMDDISIKTPNPKC